VCFSLSVLAMQRFGLESSSRFLPSRSHCCFRGTALHTTMLTKADTHWGWKAAGAHAKKKTEGSVFFCVRRHCTAVSTVAAAHKGNPDSHRGSGTMGDIHQKTTTSSSGSRKPPSPYILCPPREQAHATKPTIPIPC